MVPNRIAELAKAITMDPVVKTWNTVARLSPIRPAKPNNMARAVDLGGLEFSAQVIANTATKGAKITTHFITPVNKNCMSGTLDATRPATTPLTAMAMSM
jgi:hypothetical protein